MTILKSSWQSLSHALNSGAFLTSISQAWEQTGVSSEWKSYPRASPRPPPSLPFHAAHKLTLSLLQRNSNIFPRERQLYTPSIAVRYRSFNSYTFGHFFSTCGKTKGNYWCMKAHCICVCVRVSLSLSGKCKANRQTERQKGMTTEWLREKDTSPHNCHVITET